VGGRITEAAGLQRRQHYRGSRVTEASKIYENSEEPVGFRRATRIQKRHQDSEEAPGFRRASRIHKG
jgi:hypothetical protein